MRRTLIGALFLVLLALGSFFVHYRVSGGDTGVGILAAFSIVAIFGGYAVTKRDNVPALVLGILLMITGFIAAFGVSDFYTQRDIQELRQRNNTTVEKHLGRLFFIDTAVC